MEAAERDPVFSMHGMREVLRQYPVDGKRFEQDLTAIEQNITGFPDTAINLCKNLVETCCKTILAERGSPVDGTPSLNELLRNATNHLQFGTPDHPQQVKIHQVIKRIIGGINGSVGGIGELRNIPGLGGHGAQADWPAIHHIHARFVATATDSLSAFLYAVHRSQIEQPKPTAQYEDSAEFNEWIDAQYGAVDILDANFLASRIVFELDRTLYDAALQAHQTEEQDDPVTAPEPGVGE